MGECRSPTFSRERMCSPTIFAKIQIKRRLVVSAAYVLERSLRYAAIASSDDPIIVFKTLSVWAYIFVLSVFLSVIVCNYFTIVSVSDKTTIIFNLL